MERIPFKHAVVHIFRISFFRLILFIFFLISVGLFLVEGKIIFPLLQKMQMASIESEATRTANHLRNLLHIQNEPAVNAFSENLLRNLQVTMDEFGLVKVKVYNAAGKVVYSSEPKEVGEINAHDYFHDYVAKGQVFSKIDRENQTSLEGKLVQVSVAEVYVPILNKADFQGAFEIYYDISQQILKNHNDEFIIKLALISAWLILAFVLFSLLIKASRWNILITRAEEKCIETNSILELAVEEKTKEIKATQVASVQALAILAEYYDPNTGAHLKRIQLYVRTLLEYLALSSNQYSEYVQRNSTYIEEIVFASLLHDIGKTAIPVEILTKPEKLTAEEFHIVKDHTSIAGEALGEANQIYKEEFGKDSYLALARDIALYHHEKWNGEGYPHRLKGPDIPLSARIVAIVDVYDALTSVRPYKKAWSHEKAFEEILNGSGNHFEPDLVEAFKCCGEQFKRILENNIS